MGLQSDFISLTAAWTFLFASLTASYCQPSWANGCVSASASDSDSQVKRLPPTGPTDPDPADAVLLDNAPPSEFPVASQFYRTCKGRLSWSNGDWSVKPDVSLEMQMLSTSDEVTGRTTVLYVNQKSTLGPLPQFNVSGQPSSLGLQFHGPDVGSLHAGGRVLMNFMGARPLLNESTPFLINAYGELSNESCRWLFGQYFSLVNPLDPTLINFGEGMNTGNLVSYRGQLRFERFFNVADNVSVTTQVAASQQFVTNFITYEEETEENASDNGVPNIEGRVAVGLGPVIEGIDRRTFELGLSGMGGQIRALHAGQKIISVQDMIGSDIQFSTERFGVKGEFYYGQGLGSYGGGIGQSLNNYTALPIRDTGGWFELWTKPMRKVTVATGYGIDCPLEIDFDQSRDAQRTRNEFYYVTVLWDVTAFFNVGIELDYRKTDWIIAPPTETPGVRLFENNDAVVCFFRTKLMF